MVDQEVVISGLAGCFPGSDDVDELRENLYNGVDLVTDKDCRWNLNDKHSVPNATGKLKNASKFDAAHFGIHRKQVESLDPMTCIMLERSFEAVYDAGINPATLKGRSVGVYMGSTFSEADNVFDYVESSDGFGILGHNRSMLATRVSYYLDINGPSMVLLSSWTCGLTALTTALRDIKSGRCSAALVGTPNLTLFPVMSWHLAELGLLSRDAKCKSFDSAADGYGRSDAVVVLFLQRQCDAKRVYASVVHSDVRFFGEHTTFLRPHRTSIATLLRDFYNSCGVDPTELVFLEADGSGVKDNDREELNGIEEALLRHRTSPLLIGSVKSNLGHTESSASLVSIVKMLIAMETRCIPGNLHYKQPAHDIPALEQSRLKVVTESTPWSGGYVGINSVGIAGDFGHVLLRSHDKVKVSSYDGLPRLVTASSRTEASLTRVFNKIISTPYDAEHVRLVQDVHASNIIGHIYRGYTIIEPGKHRNINVAHFPGQKRPVWFVFSGMGSQWPGMGTQLMQLPVFRASIDKCHAILEPRGLDLRHIITTPDATIFDNILHCFVGIAAVQIALTDVLTCLGIQPDGVIGHSVGELGCGYADGCLTAEQMILASYARGRASLEVTLIKGMMAAVGLGHQQIAAMLPPSIEVACHNGPDSSTISGPVKEVEQFVAELKSKGIFARSVNVANIAYHSRYIQPAAPGLLSYLKEIIPVACTRSSHWISTSVPEDAWDSPLAQTCSAEYHTNNLLSSVLFAEGSRHLPPDAIVIEVAPHGLLQAVLRGSLGEGCTYTALTRRGHADAVDLLLSAVGKLYTLGLHPQVANIYAPVEFPVSLGTPSISPIISWEHTENWPIANDLESQVVDGELEVEVSLRQEDVRLYAGHKINGLSVFPPAAYLKYAWDMLASIVNSTHNQLPVVFEDVRFHDLVYIPEQGSLNLHLMVQRGSGQFEVAEGKKVLATGLIRVSEKIEKEFIPTAHVQRSGSLLTSEDLYREMEHRGHVCRGQMRSIVAASLNETGSVCRVQWHNNWLTFIECMMQQRIYQTGAESQDILTLSSIRKLVIDPSKHSARDTEFEVISHLASSVIQGGGVQIQGMKTRRLLPNKPTPVHMDARVFVPYGTTRLESIEDFVDVSIQIAMECCQPHCRVTVIESKDTHSLTHQIQTCLRNYDNIELDVKTTCSNAPAPAPKANSFLVVTTPSLLNHGALFLGPTGGFLLTRYNETDSWAFAPDIVVVADQQFGNERYVLLRKIPHNPAVPRVIKVAAEDDKWKTHLRRSLDAKKHVLLVGEGEPPAGLLSHVAKVNNEGGGTLARSLFVLGNSAPPFSLSEKWYQPQLQRGLVSNIYRNQSWGSYRLLSLNEDSYASTLPPTLTLDGVELNYLGLNKRDFGTDQCVMGHMDFSGRSGPHRWVMGITRCGDSKPDPLLTWPVPDSWSLEGAATVPLAYATAYNAVSILGYERRGEKILVHAGASGVGQAAIAVAMAAGLQVFTTVSSKKQRDFLVKRFHDLQEHCIYNSEDSKFEHDLLLATKGRGVEIVLNCWSGDRFQASLRCLSMFGRFIQLSKTDFEQNVNVGLTAFKDSVSFYGAASDSLFNASHKQKVRLHGLVADGITSGVVQPLDRSVFLYQQYDRALGMLADDDQISRVLINVREAKRALNMPLQQTEQLKFDSRGSCLIIGGTVENWLDLSKWLLEHGARRLIVSQSSPVTEYISRRVNLLGSFHQATITLTANSPATPSGTDKLIEEVNSYGPLVSIFTLPSKHKRESCRELLRNLDCATRQSGVQHFVSLLCAGAENVCQARSSAGFHGLAVRWADDDEGLGLVLSSLDRLLGSNVDNTVVLSTSTNNTPNDNNQSSDETERLGLFLPATLPDLLLLGAEVTTNSAPLELATSSPGMAHVKEVPPVFLVPGLQGPVQKVLQDFARGLMYPAIGLKLPRDGSIQQMASSLAAEVKRIQPSGPYNIVGESWGGTVALEVAKSLEGHGDKIHVFLLEGAPATAQATARHLGDGDHLETNLIFRLLNLDSDELKKDMLGARNWESRLNLAIARVAVGTAEDTDMIKAAITATHSRIMALLKYKSEESLATSLITLVRSRLEEEDTCGLIKYCKNTVNVFRVGSQYKAMLSSQDTANIISDNVIM